MELEANWKGVGLPLGYEFRLILRPEAQRRWFFSPAELARVLRLVRRRQTASDPRLYPRLVNGDEGFTLTAPPLFFWGAQQKGILAGSSPSNGKIFSMEKVTR